jgi:hypothetical protein
MGQRKVCELKRYAALSWVLNTVEIRMAFAQNGMLNFRQCEVNLNRNPDHHYCCHRSDCPCQANRCASLFFGCTIQFDDRFFQFLNCGDWIDYKTATSQHVVAPSINPRLRLNIFRLIGERIFVDSAVIEFDAAAGAAPAIEPADRVLHPVFVVAVGEILVRVGAA